MRSEQLAPCGFQIESPGPTVLLIWIIMLTMVGSSNLADDDFNDENENFLFVFGVPPFCKLLKMERFL